MSLATRVTFIVSVCASSAIAFDPFTVMAVVSTGVSIVSSISDGASELAGAADAFSELYSEVDPEAEVSQGAKRLIQKMREVEALAHEAGETKEAIDGLLQHDREQAKSLTTVLRKLTQAVKTAKRLGRLLSKLEKKAQMAQLEMVEVEREQLRVQYKLLEEQIARGLEEKKLALEQLASKRQQIATHLKEMRSRGARSFGKSGVFSFPKRENVLPKAIELAKKIRPLLLGLVALAFFLRVVFYQVSFSGSSSYGDLIRDVAVCGFLLAAFPQIIDGCLSVSDALAKSIAGNKLQDLTEAPRFPAGSFLLNWDVYVMWIASWIRFCIYVAVDFLFSFGIAFLVVLFPIVIFAGTMFNFATAWPIFLGSFLLLTLWPFFWNSIGVLASTLLLADSMSISDQLKTALFAMLQLASPMIAMSILKGSSVRQAVTNAYNSTQSLRQPARATAAGVAAVAGHGSAATGRGFRDVSARVGAASRGYGDAKASKNDSMAPYIGQANSTRPIAAAAKAFLNPPARNRGVAKSPSNSLSADKTFRGKKP